MQVGWRWNSFSFLSVVVGVGVVTCVVIVLIAVFRWLVGPPPCAPTNGRPGFSFGFLGAGRRLPKARRGRVFIVHYHYYWLVAGGLLVTPTPHLRHNTTSQQALEFDLGAVVDLKESPPYVAPSR